MRRFFKLIFIIVSCVFLASFFLVEICLKQLIQYSPLKPTYEQKFSWIPWRTELRNVFLAWEGTQVISEKIVLLFDLASFFQGKMTIHGKGDVKGSGAIHGLLFEGGDSCQSTFCLCYDFISKKIDANIRLLNGSYKLPQHGTQIMISNANMHIQDQKATLVAQFFDPQEEGQAIVRSEIELVSKTRYPFSAIFELDHFSFTARSYRFTASGRVDVLGNLDHINVKKDLNVIHRLQSIPHQKSLILPEAFKNIPFAEQSGLISTVRNISLNQFPEAFNASIIEDGNSYLFFFRSDKLSHDLEKHDPFSIINLTNSCLGVASLNRQFQPIEETTHLFSSLGRFPEDPRAIKIGEQLYLIFNDFNGKKRNMKISKLDLKKNEIVFQTEIDFHRNAVEKNWVPFVYNGTLHFVYDIQFQEILRMNDLEKGVCQIVAKRSTPFKQAQQWQEKWGILRGGTPASLLDQEYICFFHSSFTDKDNNRWYAMGAYTFEASPPFKVTRISKYPILFQSIYSTPTAPHISSNLKCIFPCGLVCEQEADQSWFHVSCGENDSGVKIITFGKELLDSLEEVVDE